jgi:cytochrome d ubiquinol oxidase subunit I
MWLAPLQVVIGDLHGLNTLHYQPAKVAALEAHWETGREVPLILFALPDPKAETNHYEIALPKLGSLILTHERNGEVVGLKSFPPEDRPNPIIPFFAFRIMVGIGLIMIAVGLVGAVLWLTGRLYTSRWFLRTLVWVSPLGFLAVLAGWFTAEVGRQPWVVYGVLRTADAVTPFLTTREATISLAIFCSVYAFIFLFGTFYIYRLIRIGPVRKPFEVPHLMVPNRPMSLVDEEPIQIPTHITAGE